MDSAEHHLPEAPLLTDGEAPVDGWTVLRTVVWRLLGSYLFWKLLAVAITAVILALWMRFSSGD